ncbi:DUF222 domain-containing protein [Corynebacterium sp. 335C]
MASLRASLSVLGDIAKGADKLPWDDALAIAAEFERTMSRRSGFDLAFTEFAMGDAAQRRSGTTDTCGFLSRVLGISRAQARERMEAVRVLGDVEPEDDDGGDLPPDEAGLFGGGSGSFGDGPETDDGPDADAAAAAAAAEAAARAAEEERLRRERERSREEARRKASDGDITPAKLDALRRELKRLRSGGSMTAEDIKARILKRAGEWNADRVRRETRALVDKSNAHAAPDPFSDLRERDFWVSKQADRDGSFRFGGRMPAHSAALLRKYLTTHAVKGAGIELPDGVDDRRSQGQRNMDAFSRMIDGAMHAEPGAHAAGHATVVVTFRGRDGGMTRPDDGPFGDRSFGDDHASAHHSPGPHDGRVDGCGADGCGCGHDHPHPHAHGAGGGPGAAGFPDGRQANTATMTGTTNVGIDLTLAQVLRLGLDTHWYAALVDGDPAPQGMNLRLGRSARTATTAQRIALQVFDGCCQHPGCDRPLDECDVHHIVAWLAGGRTDIENLVPLCRTHHVNNDDTWSDVRKGHMTPRTAANGHRSGWSGPVHPDGTPLRHPSHAESPGGGGRNRPGPRRATLFNDSPPSRAAEGYPAEARPPESHSPEENPAPGPPAAGPPAAGPPAAGPPAAEHPAAGSPRRHIPHHAPHPSQPGSPVPSRGTRDPGWTRELDRYRDPDGTRERGGAREPDVDRGTDPPTQAKPVSMTIPREVPRSPGTPSWIQSPGPPPF